MKKFRTYQSAYKTRDAISSFAKLNVGYVILVGLALIVAVILLTRQSVQKPLSKQSESQSQRVTVIDGDTIGVGGDRFRLHGIDAPEKSQPCTKENETTFDCGKAATEYLEYLTLGENVVCESTGKDRWGRYIGKCSTDTISDLGRQMVRSGWAIAYTEYSTDYVADHQTAKDSLLGIWATNFVTPQEWRKNRGK